MPAKQWDNLLLDFTTVFWIIFGYYGFGAVGKAGELQFLGAFLPEPALQENRGVPWAPSPLCFLSGVLVAVMCCKVLPQKNLCCKVLLSPFKKSALSETCSFGGLLFRLPLSVSFCFFVLSCFLLRGWERWLFDLTFLLWTDFDDCCLLAVFVFLVSGTTLAQDAHLPHWLRGVAPPAILGRFLFWCFRFFFFSA